MGKDLVPGNMHYQFLSIFIPSSSFKGLFPCTGTAVAWQGDSWEGVPVYSAQQIQQCEHLPFIHGLMGGIKPIVVNLILGSLFLSVRGFVFQYLGTFGIHQAWDPFTTVLVRIDN